MPTLEDISPWTILAGLACLSAAWYARRALVRRQRSLVVGACSGWGICQLPALVLLFDILSDTNVGALNLRLMCDQFGLPPRDELRVLWVLGAAGVTNLTLGLFIDNICAKRGFRHVFRMPLARCAGGLTAIGRVAR